MKTKTEIDFQYIVKELARNSRDYENGSIQHIKYVESIDYLFNSFSWSKVDFYQELNRRLNSIK